MSNRVAFLRQLEIIFTSTKFKKQFKVGDYSDGKNNLNIQIRGSKYLSSLKDEFTITISNLTYIQILELINGQYYDIEIKVGYKNLGLHRIFKGSVLFISNNLGDKKTNEVIIICASKLVSSFGQTKMNFTLNSGINLYSAINFLLRQSGITNCNIDNDFKNQIINEVISANSNPSSFLDTFSKSKNLFINTDYTYDSVVNIWSPYRKDSRIIKLTSENILLTGGYPTLSSQGLNLSILPTFGLMPGDTIEIDNSLVNIYASSKSEVEENKSIYLDTSTSTYEDLIKGNSTGRYVIYQLEYNLSNRDSDFSVNIIAKAKSIISKFIGGTN